LPAFIEARCKGKIMIKKLQALRECIRKLPAIAKDEIEVKEEALRLIAELQKDLNAIGDKP